MIYYLLCHDNRPKFILILKDKIAQPYQFNYLAVMTSIRFKINRVNITLDLNY